MFGELLHKLTKKQFTFYLWLFMWFTVLNCGKLKNRVALIINTDYSFCLYLHNKYNDNKYTTKYQGAASVYQQTQIHDWSLWPC